MMDRQTVINVILLGSLGGILPNLGFGLMTWQFWLVMCITWAIQINSMID